MACACAVLSQRAQLCSIAAGECRQSLSSRPVGHSATARSPSEIAVDNRDSHTGSATVHDCILHRLAAATTSAFATLELPRILKEGEAKMNTGATSSPTITPSVHATLDPRSCLPTGFVFQCSVQLNRE